MRRAEMDGERNRTRNRFERAREVFYGLLAPGAEKGNVVAVI